MKRMHILVALLICALLLSATCALAAVDTSAVPTFTITAPTDPVTSGSTLALIVTPKLPGFLTLRLTDPYGSEVLTIFNNRELHTKDNELSVSLRDAQGNLLAPGMYTLSGSMVTQFGVSSDVVSAQLTIQAPAADVVAAGTGGIAALPVPSADLGMTVPTGATAAVGATASAGAAAAGGYNLGATGGYNLDTTGGYNLGTSTAPLPVPGNSAYGQTMYDSYGSETVSLPVPSGSGVSYTVGYGSVGEEGLYIGVGVIDVAQQPDAGYWGLSADASDEEIWAALIKDMVSVDVDEKESAYIYDSVGKSQKRIGTVCGLSQGVNVLYERGDGWSLVEAFRNEDGAFVRGYMRNNRLRTVKPNQNYGIVVDKTTQTLTVYRDGQRVGSCPVTTGMPTANYLQRETPAGEYITVTRRGTTEYANGKGYSLYSVRFNGNYHLCELPTTRRGGTDYSLLLNSLGTKASRGNITLPHQPSTDGGINAKWIWDMTDSNKKVKILIFDDKPRSNVPVGA